MKMHSTKEIPLQERNIVLIGFMGAGKTTVGQLVAQKLCRDFIDVDHEIERAFQMTIPEIFKRFGEKTFRKKEREIVIDYCYKSRLKVISLGGGAFLQEPIRKACLETSMVILLHLSWEAWKDRLELIMDHRPLLQNRSLEEIEQLFRKRQQAYAMHHSKIHTDGMKPEEVADRIVQSLQLGWEIDTSHV